MKKGFILLMGAAAMIMISGCDGNDLPDILNQAQDVTVSPAAAPKERVYIDEIRGTLEDFDGNQITLVTDSEETYYFDVSDASLECKAGMIVGDEISVIYEGHLTSTDTSQVHALKVVDEVHKKEDVQVRTAQGEIQSITPNALTIKSKSNKVATYPITGARQYYENGLRKGTWVYIHYIGRLLPSQGEDAKVLDATHLKVISVSDMETIQPAPPEPTATPAPRTQASEEQPDKGYFGGTVAGANNEILEVMPDGKNAARRVNVEKARVSFEGGIAPGTHVTVWYNGEMGEDAVIQARAVYAEDPVRLRETDIKSSVSGVVTTVTANTVTIQTDDGVPITCDITRARNRTSQGIIPGGRISVIFHPVESKETNIYVGLEVADA